MILFSWFYNPVLSNYIPSSELFCKNIYLSILSNSYCFEDIGVIFSPSNYYFNLQ